MFQIIFWFFHGRRIELDFSQEEEALPHFFPPIHEPCRDDKHHQSLIIPKVLDFFHLLGHPWKRGATRVFSTQSARIYQGVRSSSLMGPKELTLLPYLKSSSYSLPHWEDTKLPSECPQQSPTLSRRWQLLFLWDWSSSLKTMKSKTARDQSLG